MIFIVVIYACFVFAIAYLKREYKSGDEYLMADRQASAILVAAGLFTLIGGGELVTLAALSYTFGFAGISLFLGYALAFFFLGLLSPKIRKNHDNELNLSLPDYIHNHYGRIAGHLVFIISFVAFFALLLLQYAAAGQFLSPLLNYSYNTCVIIVAFIALVYLFIGGFRTVLLTDLFQGIAMLCLLPIFIIIAIKGLSTGYVLSTANPMPLSVWISLTLTGFFVAASSADVWQRMYAAKNNKTARLGFVIGSILFIVFGFLLVIIGTIARNVQEISNAESAFIGTISLLLPKWAIYFAVVLVLSAILSTADTEMFLLGGMAEREFRRIKHGLNGKFIAEKESIGSARIMMISITGAAILLSFYTKGLVSIYTWLLSALLVISLPVLASLFIKISRKQMNLSIILNLCLFILLLSIGSLTLENSFLIVLPALLILIIVRLFSSNLSKNNYTQ